MCMKAFVQKGNAGYYSLHIILPCGEEKQYADLIRDKSTLERLAKKISEGEVAFDHIPEILEDLLP